MKTELTKHLTWWEVRHTLRNWPFWIIAAALAVTPIAGVVLGGLATDQLGSLALVSTSSLITLQIYMLSVLLSLWVVFAVKRQVLAEVSDDWLLVFGYRQALLTRYLAGALTGLLWFVASLLGTLVAVILSPLGDLAAFLALQPVVLLSLLQPLATAMVIIAAADFLLAGVPVVLTAVLLVNVFWCTIPITGYGTLPSFLLHGDAPNTAFNFLVITTLACLFMMRWAWCKSEDFWAYLRTARHLRDSTSLGAVRTALESAETPRKAADRTGRAKVRTRFEARGVDAIPAHDLARYTWLPTNRAELARNTLTVGVGALVLGIGTALWMGVTENGLPRAELSYFIASVLLVGMLLRTLTSATGIIAQEREQGTLDQLVVSPFGLSRLLNTKLRVVLRQNMPAMLLLGLWVTWSVGYLNALDWLLTLAALTLIAGIAGILGASLLVNRVLSLIIGGTLGYLLLIGSLEAVGWLGTQYALWAPPEWRLGFDASTAIDSLIVLLTLTFAVWPLMRALAQTALRRQAGLSTA